MNQLLNGNSSFLQ